MPRQPDQTWDAPTASTARVKRPVPAAPAAGASRQTAPTKPSPSAAEDLPADFGELLRLLTALDNAPPCRGRADEHARRIRLEAVRRAVKERQQIPEVSAVGYIPRHSPHLVTALNQLRNR